MADSKVSDLTAASALTGTELFYSDDGAADVKVTATQIKTFAVGAGSVSVASGKTLTLNNTLTLAGTDSSTLNIGSGGTLGSAAFTASTTYDAAGAATSAVSTHAALQTGVHGISITAGKTLSATNSLTLSGTDSTTMTFPSTSTTLAGLGIANTFTADQTISGAGLIVSGNISATTWGTNGLRYKSVPGTLTDTSAAGTVAAAYTNVYGGNTIAASNARTFTDYFTTYISEPTAGTNVTFTNKWAFGLTGNAKITGNVVASGQIYTPTQTLTDAATITWDANSSSVATVTITSTGRTLTPSNLKAGATYVLFVIQGSGGSKTITTWTNFKWVGGTAPTLSTTAGATDIITGVSDGTYIYAVAQIGFA